MRILTLIYLLLSFSLHADSYSVIIHADSDIDKVERSQLRDLYIHKRSYLNDQKIIPINLLADNDARKQFEISVLEMNRQRLNAYWVKQHFKGVSPPLTQASFQSVLLFVTNVKGAIGYVPSSEVNENVKVLYEF